MSNSAYKLNKMQKHNGIKYNKIYRQDKIIADIFYFPRYCESVSVLYDKVTIRTFRPVASAVFCPAMVSLFLQSKIKLNT